MPAGLAQKITKTDAGKTIVGHTDYCPSHPEIKVLFFYRKNANVAALKLRREADSSCTSELRFLSKD